MSSIGYRVVSRWVESASWQNAINGHYFSLLWNRSKMHLEEMPNGDPIPTTKGFGDTTKVDEYEMPILDAFIKSKMGGGFSLSIDTIRSFAHLQHDDKGPVAREKILKAHDAVLETMIKEMTEDGRTGEVEKLRHLVPELKKKLIWKKLK